MAALLSDIGVDLFGERGHFVPLRILSLISARGIKDSDHNDYDAADLFRLPHQWLNRFDLVLESYTLQVLPRAMHNQAMQRISKLSAEHGYVLLITRGRDEQDAEGTMPWPLTRSDLDKLAQSGLQEISFEDYFENESPPVRRFRVLYQKSADLL